MRKQKTQECIGKSLSRPYVRTLVSILILGISGPAWSYSCSVTKAATVNLGLPTTISVSRDKAVGSALSGWISADGGTDYYLCTGNAGETIQAHYLAPDLVSSGSTFGGYTVWKTNLDGVGIAIRVMAYGWWTQGANPGSWYGPGNVIPEAAASNRARFSVGTTGQIFQYGGLTEVALVKTGPITPGKVTSKISHSLSISGTGDDWYGGGGYDRKYKYPEITVTTLSCQTPNISVDLGSHRPADLPTVGSRTVTKKFDLRINSCPAGLASVYYGFNFHGTTGYTARDGLFGLNSTATAKGVKVKLLNGAGTSTVELDKWYTLSAYNASTGGSYTVPLSAAYERTGDVTAGSADAELVIAMSYN